MKPPEPELFYLLNIPQSAVSGVLTTWKRLGKTAGRGRPPRVTGMLRHIVHRGHQSCAESMVTDLWSPDELKHSVWRASWRGFPWLNSCIHPSFTRRRMKYCRTGLLKHFLTLTQIRRMFTDICDPRWHRYYLFLNFSTSIIPQNACCIEMNTTKSI